jgi:hypothetical protein
MTPATVLGGVPAVVAVTGMSINVSYQVSHRCAPPPLWTRFLTATLVGLTGKRDHCVNDSLAVTAEVLSSRARGHDWLTVLDLRGGGGAKVCTL